MNDDRVARAGQAVHEAVADFFLALAESRNTSEALRIHSIVSGLVLALQAAEDAALQKADQLCGVTLSSAQASLSSPTPFSSC